MLRWIMYLLSHFFPLVIVFTKTKQNGFWQKHIPERFIHPGFRAAVVKAFLNWQKKRKADPKLKEANLKVLIIEDDVISDPKLRYSEENNGLFTEGRHSDVMVAVTSQTAKGVNPTLRENTDMGFFFYFHSKNQRQSVYEDYFDFMDPNQFEAMYNHYTKNNMCLVVITNPLSKAFTENPMDCVFWAKAKDPGDFVMGCEELWKTKESM